MILFGRWVSLCREADSDEQVVDLRDEAVRPIQFPAAMLIIEHQNDVLTQVEAELKHISAETWTTTSGEIRPHTPIERVPYDGFGGGIRNQQGFFQVP